MVARPSDDQQVKRGRSRIAGLIATTASAPVLMLAVRQLLAPDSTGFEVDLLGLTSVTPSMLPVLVPAALLTAAVGLLLMIDRAWNVGVALGIAWLLAGVGIVVVGRGPGVVVLSIVFLYLLISNADENDTVESTGTRGPLYGGRRTALLVIVIILGAAGLLLLRQLIP